MLAAAPHLGSDFAVQTCGNCLLGVSNKSDFIDSTISTSGPYMAAFSGTLDNAAELAQALTLAGHPPVSPALADVVVSAFKAFGDQSPKRMRGAFIGIVTDGHKLCCFRDHIGLKPIFYRDEPRAFFAATEPKQIIAGASLAREPDFSVLEQIFYGRMPSDMPSAMKGVSRLPQATCLTANGAGTGTPHRYWNPAELLETARFTAEEVGDRFSELFAQAVARSLTGNDVIMLSGGIDSPAVAGFAAPQHLERTGRPISALSAVFPDLPSVDESKYINLVANYLGIDLHTYRIQARVLDDLKNWCQLLDGPVPTVAVPQIAEYAALARQLGFRNILGGELAEFLFTFDSHIYGHLLLHRRWNALLSLMLTERRRGVSWKKMAFQLFDSLPPGRLATWYLHMRGLDHPERIPDWLDPRKVHAEAPYRTDLLEPIHRRWSALQLVAFNGCTISMEAGELCSALYGVKSRRPFADVDLWEFFLSLPAEVKFPDLRSKTLVRRFLRGKVPAAIVDRRDKTVFDDHVMAQIDYPTLRQFLVNPKHRLPGVNYRHLADRIERQDFTRLDWFWANDLVRIHAFLSLW
jgi:asparagine synthase (glutamine-hydrolysing)